MIVTRQRKKKQSRLPILLPLAAIVMLAFAVTWGPSRNFIMNGPLRPVAMFVTGVVGVVSRPLTFAYQQQQITDSNLQIKQLNDKLEADRKAQADKDAENAKLQKQIAAMNAEPPPAPTTAPAMVPRSGDAAAAGGAAGVPSLGVSSIKRDAQQWAAMDPEAAAALVQKLPADYVARVFAVMPADSVGPVMDALPPKVAAGIVTSGAGAQISAQAGR